MSTSFSIKATIFCAAILLASAAMGQQALKAGYIIGTNIATVPDSRVVITNPSLYSEGNGDLCAMIYVFNDQQEIMECCGCVVSADGMRTLSVNTDLASNPLTGIPFHRGAVRVVSNAVNNNGACNPVSLNDPEPELLVTGTHPGKLVGQIQMTETNYSDVTLSQTEQTRLESQCYAVETLGSSHGICTCGTGD